MVADPAFQQAECLVDHGNLLATHVADTVAVAVAVQHSLHRDIDDAPHGGPEEPGDQPGPDAR